MTVVQTPPLAKCAQVPPRPSWPGDSWRCALRRARSPRAWLLPCKSPPTPIAFHSRRRGGGHERACLPPGCATRVPSSAPAGWAIPLRPGRDSVAKSMRCPRRAALDPLPPIRCPPRAALYALLSTHCPRRDDALPSTRSALDALPSTGYPRRAALDALPATRWPLHPDDPDRRAAHNALPSTRCRRRAAHSALPTTHCPPPPHTAAAAAEAAAAKQHHLPCTQAPWVTILKGPPA